jgi:hypothetical protein
LPLVAVAPLMVQDATVDPAKMVPAFRRMLKVRDLPAPGVDLDGETALGRGRDLKFHLRGFRGDAGLVGLSRPYDPTKSRLAAFSGYWSR